MDFMAQTRIDIIDFGSQYTQLIARSLRELNIYCEISPYNNYSFESFDVVKGIILSGSPCSVHQSDAPGFDFDAFLNRLPILAICYGSQLYAHHFGGSVVRSEIREYGRANLSFVQTSAVLLRGLEQNTQVWMSHGDTIAKLPQVAEKIASTDHVEFAAYQVVDQQFYALQFHPEVYHSLDGKQILSNFVYDICGLSPDFTPDAFVEVALNQIKQQVGTDKVILGLSGGVDSSVAGLLIHKAIGDQLTGIFVDNGLLRKEEFEQVLESYQSLGLQIKAIDAKEQFYKALKGVSDPEEKRKIIGRVFIEVFDRAAAEIKDAKWLAQGTIYPDVIESVSVNGPSATIKSHHNVGGLPDHMKLQLLEPLKQLFKDEVRRVGKTLELPLKILNRHPFPGPGLAIRILGEITPEKIAILQEVDAVFINGLKAHNLYDQVWQAGAMLLPVQSVGVMGDERTYESVVALRAVSSTDGMTADWVHLPYEFLAEISNQIINRVKGVNRVVYDISSKPPATIEWE